MTLPNLDGEQVKPLAPEKKPDQVTPSEGEQEETLTVEKVEGMMKEAVAEGAEIGFRRAQGLTAKVETRLQGEIDRLNKVAGIEVTAEQKEKLRRQIETEEETTAPTSTDQQDDQPAPTDEETQLDPVTQKAHAILDEKGIRFLEGDPELKMLVLDKEPDDYLKSVTEARDAKIKRLASPDPSPRTPTSIGSGGAQVDENFGDKSMDETYEAAEF